MELNYHEIHIPEVTLCISYLLHTHFNETKIGCLGDGKCLKWSSNFKNLEGFPIYSHQAQKVYREKHVEQTLVITFKTFRLLF